MEDKGNTVVKQGIDMAVPMALYTTAISLMWIYVDKVPALSYLMLAMLLGGPVLLYYLQRRFFKMSNSTLGMWDLWRMGVVTIFFGTVFTLLVTYCFYEYVRPDYIYIQMQNAIDIYRSTPGAESNEMANALETMLAQDNVPSSWAMALSMFFITNISGMLMGLFTSMLASRKSH